MWKYIVEDKEDTHSEIATIPLWLNSLGLMYVYNFCNKAEINQGIHRLLCLLKRIPSGPTHLPFYFLCSAISGVSLYLQITSLAIRCS